MVHFSPKTLDFLFENRMHNSKTWFDEHKEEYQSLVFEPLRDLVEYLTPTALFIDPHLTTEARVDKTISRIRRDTRFPTINPFTGTICGSFSGGVKCMAPVCQACILR